MALYDFDREYVTTQIYINGVDVTGYAVWALCQFEAVASSEPGSCTIVLKDRLGTLDFIGGERITLYVNDVIMWQGYAFTVDQGYFFPDYAERRWTIRGVDLNIVLKKLILYNHADPRKSLDGGGYYPRATNGQVEVPQNTQDSDYIEHMLDDTDIGDHTLNMSWSLSPIAKINPDSKFTPPNPGITLYDFMVDVSANVMKSQPGSVVWYVNPYGILIYREQDTDNAPFYISDDPDANTTLINGVYGLNVRALTVTTSIATLKNDVLAFTGNMNPSPDSPQQHLLYKHNQLTASVNQFGRFQSALFLPSDWLQGMVNVSTTKVLYQEGTPARQASWVTYRSGFYPGQLVVIHSKVHTFNRWNMESSALEQTDTISVPIRSVSMRWITPDVIEYQVSGSFDTQDPWGLILALKRPANRGLIPPTFYEYDRTRDPDAPVPAPVPYMFVREYPEQLSGGKWRCTYAFIRYSIAVFMPDGVRVFGTPDTATTVGFIETNPSQGIFQLASMYAGHKPLVEYHVAGPRN